MERSLYTPTNQGCLFMNTKQIPLYISIFTMHSLSTEIPTSQNAKYYASRSLCHTPHVVGQPLQKILPKYTLILVLDTFCPFFKSKGKQAFLCESSKTAYKKIVLYSIQLLFMYQLYSVMCVAIFRVIR